MAGIEDILVEWAPNDPPITLPAEPTWETLPAGWQSIRTTGGATISELTQLFTTGTAKIRVRNGDSVGRTPTFLPGSSYRGLNIRVLQVAAGTVLWRGRIDRVEFDYTNTPWAGFVTLHCVDTLGNVNDSDIPDDLFQESIDYFTHVAESMSDAFVNIMQEVNPDTVISVTGEFSHQLVKAPDKFDTRQGLLDFLNQVLLTEGGTLFASPDADELIIRGRWDALRLLATTTASITFTDAVADGVTTFPYRRDDLEWSDADEDNVNSVQTASMYLNKTVTEEDVAPGYPKVKLSRTELVTIRQGWVEANARMWFTLYRQAHAYPKKLKFLVASHGHNEASVYSNALAPLPLFDKLIHVLHFPPGHDELMTYRVAVESVDHDIDRQRWMCELGFTSLDRWWFGYGNGVDPIALIEIDGDSDHGIDSLAIIAP